MTTSATDQSTTGKHIPALDGVRGLAVAMVMLLHLFVRNSRPGGPLLVRVVTAIMASGWVGVDLFFVLSGFLITGILYDTLGTPHFFRNFYIRRSLRIFPLYYGFLFVVVAISSIQGYFWYKRGLLEYLTYTSNLWPWSYTDAPWVNLNHLWSLAIEEQFYLIWPSVVFLLRSKKKIAAVALCGVVFSLGMRIYERASGWIERDHYVQYSFTPSHLDGLLMGAVLALLIRSHWRGTVLRVAPWLLAVTVTFWTVWLVRNGPLPSILDPFIGEWGITLLSVTFASLVASALIAGSVVSTFFSTSVMRMLGRYSYGLYIFHYAVHQVLDPRIWGAVSLRTNNKVLPIVASGVVCVAVTFALTLLSFHLFEQPILRLKNRFAAHGGKPRLNREVAEANAAREGA